MPWNNGTLAVASSGLRQAAENGGFVPFIWRDGSQETDAGGFRARGCGWGLVGWFIAVAIGGTEWATKAIPVGATQTEVNRVLKLAGLTRDEIKKMNPYETWTHFDAELEMAFENRHDDWNGYILKSLQLAEFFITVLERVEDAEPKNVRTRVYLPASIMAALSAAFPAPTPAPGVLEEVAT